jgi:hypothetical protein
MVTVVRKIGILDAAIGDRFFSSLQFFFVENFMSLFFNQLFPCSFDT